MHQQDVLVAEWTQLCPRKKLKDYATQSLLLPARTSYYILHAHGCGVTGVTHPPDDMRNLPRICYADTNGWGLVTLPST
jgi:hypothetical protein